MPKGIILFYKLVLKSFYKKMIKQLILLTSFYIYHKNSVKIFLLWFINNFSKNTH